MRALRSLRAATILFSFAACLLTACAPQRTPQHYLLPLGFTGWAYIKYDDQNCQALEMRDGRRVARIPPDGRLCTSTPFQSGVARDLWEYVRPDGTTSPLDDSREISHEAFHEPGHFEMFLVGAANGATPDPSPFR